MNLLVTERRALAELSTWLRERFADRLRELRLFGSRARGEGHEHSDLDVLVVVDGLTADEAREIAHFSGDLLTRHEVLVSAMALHPDHIARLRRTGRAIARDIDRDGVPL